MVLCCDRFKYIVFQKGSHKIHGIASLRLIIFQNSLTTIETEQKNSNKTHQMFPATDVEN